MTTASHLSPQEHVFGTQHKPQGQVSFGDAPHPPTCALAGHSRQVHQPRQRLCGRQHQAQLCAAAKGAGRAGAVVLVGRPQHALSAWGGGRDGCTKVWAEAGQGKDV